MVSVTRFPPPLQYSIPIVLFCLSSLSGVYAFHREVSMANQRVEAQTLEQGRFSGSKTASLLEFIYRTSLRDDSNLEGANLVVSQMGGNPNLELAVLLNERNSIVLATSYSLRGRSVQAIPIAVEGQVDTLLNQARQSLAGQVKFSPNGESLYLFYPVRFHPKPGELRSSRIGVLLLEYNLLPQKQKARQDALWRSLQTTGILVFLYAIAWLFFERMITRRAMHLVAVSDSWANGNLSDRAQLQGSDELSQISTAFNRMTRQLQQKTQNLHEANRNRQRAEEALRQIIEGTAALTGQDFFPALARHIAEALEVRYVSISEASDQGYKILALCVDGELKFPGEIPFDLLPCCTEVIKFEQDLISNSAQCHHSNDCISAQSEYLNNFISTKFKVADHLSISLLNSKEVPIGNLCVLHDKPLQNPDWTHTLLHIFAARAGAELERHQASTALETLNNELEKRVQKRTEELQERELQLQAINRELMRANRLKDEFLANMSHELRTPLNAILGMAESLQEQIFGSTNEKQNKALRMIEDSGSHLLELINEILDLAKIQSGKIELNLQSTPVFYLCHSSLVFIKQQACKKRIQVISEIPEKIPDLVADELRIKQALINLLSNAVKFTPECGKITLKIEAFLKPEISKAATSTKSLLTETTVSKPYVRFSVHDTGIGISPENRSKLFKPFMQVDGALNRKYSGTGLGLALVKQIVDLHGGEVGLVSEVGIGSCFSFSLPYPETPTIMELIENQQKPSYEACQYADLSKENPIILVADNNELSADTTLEYLTAKGYSIRHAKNGQETVEKACSESPSLILMDTQMSGSDGLAVIEEIRKVPTLRTMPIIALTALAMDSDQAKYLQAKATYCLSKPVQLKQVAIKIKQILNQ